MGESIEGATLALWRGELGEDAFLRQTRVYWIRVASAVWNRWRVKLPRSVERADVEQEFLMQVLVHVPEWRPEKGLSIVAFATWGAVKRTQRAIHGMRGARIHGNEGKNRGRPEKSFTDYVAASSRRRKCVETDGDFDPCDLVPVFAEQDSRAIVRELLDDALAGATTVRDAFVMLALRDCSGDLDEAALALFESFASRVECELRDVEHARRVIGMAVAGLSETNAAKELVGETVAA